MLGFIHEVQTDIEKQDCYKGLKEQLGLFKDEDQILKCRGRLSFADKI